MSRTLITGAFGYVGLAAVGRLAGDGPVVAVGHPPRAAVPVDGRAEPHIERIFGDVSLAADRVAAGDVDGVIHLAGGGGEGKVREDPVAAVRSIVHGTAILAEAARR